MVAAIVTCVVIGFLVSVVANVATTVYLHRALSHRALTLSRPADHVFRALVWITTGIRRRQWVAVHRKHHAYTDVPGDPHSPVLLGWWKVQTMNVALYRREARNTDTVARYARDLPRTRLDRMLYDHALVGLALGTAVLVAAFGWAVGLGAAFVHLNIYLGGSAAVNAIGHRFGRRPHPNGAGNLHWLAFMTAGEGYHNNHHAAPTSARLGRRWYDVDVGWWVIKLLAWCRLATVRLHEAKLTSRPRRAAGV
jgi:stearoyl-CoA desaturase (Delta-9 desaturase)